MSDCPDLGTVFFIMYRTVFLLFSCSMKIWQQLHTAQTSDNEEGAQTDATFVDLHELYVPSGSPVQYIHVGIAVCCTQANKHQNVYHVDIISLHTVFVSSVICSGTAWGIWPLGRAPDCLLCCPLIVFTMHIVVLVYTIHHRLPNKQDVWSVWIVLTNDFVCFILSVRDINKLYGIPPTLYNFSCTLSSQ